MKQASLKDIAKLVGVSPSTVSFVLNGKAREMRISDTISKKIVRVAKREGYLPNQAAVRLRTGKSQVLGLIVESVSGSFFAELARVMEEEADKSGYKLLYCATENDGKKGRELIRMLSQQQVDGYIITPAPGMEQDIANLVARNKPVVFLDSYLPGIDVPHVLVNNYDGVAKAIGHLVDKGYRKIGFITVDLDLIQIKQRGKAYQDTLRAHQLPVSKQRTLTLRYTSRREEALDKITAFIKNAPGLDAVLFATNYLGLLGLESIQRLELTIPGDLAVISFDDHDAFRLFPKGVTIIQQPVEAIATSALQLLLGQLGKKRMTGTDKVQLPGRLVIRGTT